MSTERNPAKTRKQIEIWVEDFIWFEKTHPGASLAWLCSNLIHAYREVCENPKGAGSLEDLTIFSLSKAAAELHKEKLDNST